MVRAVSRLWILLVLAFVVHAPSLGNDFALDDRFIARAEAERGSPNVMIAQLQPFGDYFTSPYWRGIDESLGLDSLYRPVAVWSYAIVYHLIGRHLGDAEALPQHAVNVLLFVLATWLVHALLTMLGVVGGARFAGVAVFAVHAIHVEAVAAVVGRAELLAFVGGLGFVLLGERVATARGARRTGFALAAAASLFVGLCAKESGLMFLPLAPLVFVARRLRADRTIALPRTLLRGALLAALLGALPTLVYLSLRQNALAAIPPDYVIPWLMNPLAELPAAERVPSAVMIWGYGLWKMLCPYPLACDYGAGVFRLAASWFDLRVLAAAVALLLPAVVALRFVRRDPLPALAVASFLGLGFATSNVPLAIGTQFAERLCFSPSLAVPLLVAALWPGAAARWPRAARGVLVLWCMLSASVAFTRTFAWRDDATLYRTDVTTQPDSLFVRLNVAVVALASGDMAEREAHLRAAVAIAPDYAPAWNDLGMVLFQRRDLANAEAAFRRALAGGRYDRPGNLLDARMNLALVLLDQGRAKDALDLLEQLVPYHTAALTQRLAHLYQHLQARADGERVLAFLRSGQQASSDIAWQLVEGMHLVHLRRYQQAIDRLQGVRPGPALPAIVHNARLQLARALAAMVRHDEAAAICRELEGSADVAPDVRQRASALRAELRR